jgi:hypothetical protein
MLALLSFVLLAATEPPPTAPALPASIPQPTTPADPAPAPAAQPAAGAADVAAGSGAVFRTKKNLGDLEKCLTDRLSQAGEVTSVPIEGVKTLMYQTVDEPAMMIDLAPPVVKVTTKFAIGTEPIVRSCL